MALMTRVIDIFFAGVGVWAAASDAISVAKAVLNYFGGL